jgi:PilZ domain-containing protein
MTNGKEPPPLQAAQNYNKLRRTQRVHIQMAVIVRGTSKGKPFQEETKTTTVNANGCLVSLAAPLARGQQVSIVNSKTVEELTCNVAFISENKGSKTEVGLEFTEPSPLFWRIGFPPEDWSESSERKRAPAPPRQKSADPQGKK